MHAADLARLRFRSHCVRRREFAADRRNHVEKSKASCREIQDGADLAVVGSVDAQKTVIRGF